MCELVFRDVFRSNCLTVISSDLILQRERVKKAWKPLHKSNALHLFWDKSEIMTNADQVGRSQIKDCQPIGGQDKPIILPHS